MPSAPMIFITPRGKERPSRRRRPQLGQDVRSGAPYAHGEYSRPTAVAQGHSSRYIISPPGVRRSRLACSRRDSRLPSAILSPLCIVAELPRKKRVSPRPDGIVGQLLDGRATPGPRGVERKLLSHCAKVVGGNHLQQQSAKNRTAFRARDEVRQEDLIPIVPVLGRACETPRGRWRKKGRRRGRRGLKPLLDRAIEDFRVLLRQRAGTDALFALLARLGLCRRRTVLAGVATAAFVSQVIIPSSNSISLPPAIRGRPP